MKSVRLQLQDSENSLQLLLGQDQEVAFKLKMKSDKDSHVRSELEAKSSEASNLSSHRAAVQRAQQDYDNLRQTHDEFFEQFNSESVELKKRMKDVSDQLHSLQDDINSDAQMIQEMSLHRNEVGMIIGAILIHSGFFFNIMVFNSLLDCQLGCYCQPHCS
ncbi:hypothetical protein EON65_07955 [archaeon]|nr:MAG: hypothetical protein EON65_07955 [archaeon]